MFREIPLTSKQKKRGAKRTKIHGIGINDAPYQTTIKINGLVYTCPYFSRWKFMFDRCYSKSWLTKHPTYRGCTVAPEWHSFMAFRHWMIGQQWQGLQLDKDLLSQNEKVYSPTTCLFVSAHVNSLFNIREASRGKLPLGIYARNGLFEVGVSLGKAKRTWVGAYKTVSEAIDAFIAAKSSVARELANKQTDPRVKKAILDYLRYFTDEYSLLKAGY